MPEDCIIIWTHANLIDRIPYFCNKPTRKTTTRLALNSGGGGGGVKIDFPQREGEPFQVAKSGIIIEQPIGVEKQEGN